ncbi:MAG: response regulator [Elusimicrobia bacterium]|nr:response regulator [Elusimicrobiota bacterium]
MTDPPRTSVLVVDDEPGVREMLDFELKARGWEVVTTESGAKALELLGRQNFHLMLSDVRMPGMDGLSLLEIVKLRSPQTEVVLMTGDGTVETAVAAMRLGAYDFVLKPFEIDVLMRTADKALERKDLKSTLSIYVAAQAIHKSIELDEILTRIVEIGARLVQADDASLLILEDDALTVAACTGLDGEEPRRARIALGERVAGRAAASGESYLILGPLADDERFKDVPGLRGVRSSLIQPLVSSGAVFGVLCANRTASPLPFDESEARTLSLFAIHAVQAVVNARLMRQLSLSQAHLKESERINALGRVAASVAHEINNPLTGILGSAQMLETSNLTPEQADDVACILEQTERCRRIVEDLLTFGRGTPPILKPEPVVALVESALRLIRWDIADGIAIAREFTDTPDVLADALQIKQVLINFVRNALQAMASARAPKLTLRIRPDGDMVRVEVSDNGQGFDEALRKKLFKPFFTTKAPGQGAGLGLSVCAGIAAAHGGALEAVSRPGEGATFALLLPRVKEAG